LIGIVEPQGAAYGTVRAVGAQLVTVPVGWDLAEPAEGHFDGAYIRSVARQVAAARAAGLSVVLDLGIQYAPGWVMHLDASSQFIDQYGDRFGGSRASGDDVPNGVTDGDVRTRLERYLGWLAFALDRYHFYAVRVGGGPDGELRYPPASYDRHTDCFWAFDPDSQATYVVRGWRPGRGTTRQAGSFLQTYNANLADYGAWLDGVVHSDFSGAAELLMLPGWGERPGDTEKAIRAGLRRGSVELNSGTDWKLQLGKVPYPRSTIAYTTWLDAQSQGDSPQRTDPAEYLATLVRGTELRLGGEDTGGGGLADLELSLHRATIFHFTLLDWLNMPRAGPAGERAGAGPTPLTRALFVAALHAYLRQRAVR
jgi:hypothetical protein